MTDDAVSEHDNRPRYSPQISLGNVLQIGMMIAGLSVGYAVIQAQAKANADAIREIRLDITKTDDRVRGLENDRARSDERFSNILALLARIDGRLERIEGDGR